MRLLCCAILTSFLWTSQVLGAGSVCLDRELSSDLLRQFNFLDWAVDSVHSAGAWQRLIEVDPCDESLIANSVLRALIFLQQTSNQNLATDEFHQNMMGDSVLEFFRQRVQTVKLESLGSPFCRGTTAAFVVMGEESKREIHICPHAKQFSTLIVSSVLVHEARHVDGFPHATCKGGMYAGRAACDISYESAGSYGVGTELMVKASRAKNISPAARQEARAEAMAELLIRFTEAPLGIESGALLLAEDRDLYFFNGQKLFLLIAKIPETTKVVLRDLPTFFDTLDGSVRGFFGGQEMHRTRGPFAADYRALPAERQRRLLDAVYGAQSCMLFDDSIRCEQGALRIDWPLPAGLRPLKFMSVAGPFSTSLSIIDQDGERWRMPPDSEMQTWKPSEIVKTEQILRRPFISMISYTELKLGLGIDGTVLRNIDPFEGWVPHPDFTGQKYRNLMGPFYWSPHLLDL